MNRANLRVRVLALCLPFCQEQCFADGNDWYPKATDSCAQFLAEIPALGDESKKSQKRKLDSANLRRDPSMSKLFSELNASIGGDENSSGYALLALINFCNSHAIIKLGAITSQAVINEPVSDDVLELVKKLFDIDLKAEKKKDLARPPTSSSVKPPAVATSPPPIRPRQASPTSRADSYEIEVSHNDELFIINGEKFEAQTYCFDMEEGDAVIFLEGSPLGACASAVLFNLRSREKCDVWCE
jgi:hypothetical protein